MIITYLYGGLGNQMFQYAIGRKLSLKHNTGLKLNTDWFKTEIKGTTVREYELNHFKLNAQIASEEDLAKIKKPYSNFFLERVFTRWQLQLPYYKRRIIEEKHFHFDENILKAGKNTCLVGYWQSEKYFQDIRHALLQDFSFREPLAGKNEETEALIKKTTSVSLHIRRMHYVPKPPAQEVHGTCPPEYIFAAIEYIRKKITVPVFFIFSDDIAWCKENLRFTEETHFIDWNSTNNSFRDMQLMSLCKHNVIANSSFSWWAAWLNENSGKIVIAPNRWFLDNSKDIKDLFPESWVRM